MSTMTPHVYLDNGPETQLRLIPVESSSDLGPAAYIIAFLGAHIPLALAMSRVPAIATLHAMATLAVGLGWAMSGQRPERVAYVAAYITGAEVLWRMTKASVFWEYGKYAMAAAFLVAVLRTRGQRLVVLPLLYFGLLLPSVSRTVESSGWDWARQAISFNLSGPFLLAVSVWFFSGMTMSRVQILRLFLALIGPVCGLSAVTIAGIHGAGPIHFGRTSMKVTSGGYGPNQVSTILGLGALIALHLYLLSDRRNRLLRTTMLGMVAVFMVNAVLTFSRGGPYAAAGSALVGGLYLVRTRRSRAQVIAVAAILYAIGVYVVSPRLEAFTGGAFRNRFADPHTTGRALLLQADLQAWKENPVWGVGPGRATFHYALFFRGGAAHTEFSRLLAEHGVLGFGSLLLLVAMALRSLNRSLTRESRALAASLICWSFLFMLGYAMRLAAPAFVFSFVSCELHPEEHRLWLLAGLTEASDGKDDLCAS